LCWLAAKPGEKRIPKSDHQIGRPWRRMETNPENISVVYV
jgi:hypothetical protein